MREYLTSIEGNEIRRQCGTIHGCLKWWIKIILCEFLLCSTLSPPETTTGSASRHTPLSRDSESAPLVRSAIVLSGWVNVGLLSLPKKRPSPIRFIASYGIMVYPLLVTFLRLIKSVSHRMTHYRTDFSADNV